MAEFGRQLKEAPEILSSELSEIGERKGPPAPSRQLEKY
jgi:hypothetical protein